MKLKLTPVIIVMILCFGFLISPSGAGLFDKPLGDTLGSIFQPPKASEPQEDKDAISLNQNEAEGYVSVIDDTMCERPVAEFELTENAASIIFEATGNIFTDLLSGNTSLSSSLDTAKKTAKRLNWLPLDIECMYGDAIHGENIKGGHVVDRENCSRKDKKDYKKADALLEQVLAGFPDEHPYDFRMFITEVQGLDARAIPGGILYISRATLKTKYRDMAAFILSHEISHVLKRHTTKQFQATLVDSVTSVEQLKDLVTGSKPSEEMLDSFAKQFSGLDSILTSYQVNQEHQADICAVHLLHKNEKFIMKHGIDMFLKIEKEASLGQEKRQITHPMYPERERVLLEAEKKFEGS